MKIRTVNQSPKITIDLDDPEGRKTNDSYKNEVSIFVFPDTKEKDDATDGSELILDVTKLNEVMEDFGDAVTTMKRNSAVSLKDKNGNIVQIQRETEKIVEKTVNIKITEETEKIVEKVEKFQIGGRKIDISGWNDFMKGRQHHLNRH